MRAALLLLVILILILLRCGNGRRSRIRIRITNRNESPLGCTKLRCARALSQGESAVVKLVKAAKLVRNLKQKIIMAKGNNSHKKETKKAKKEKPKAAPVASRRVV